MSTNIITMLGGVLIVFTGATLAGAGIALGIQAAVPTIPPWVFFLGLGIFALTIGLVMIYIGKERTVKTVERKLTFKDIAGKHPVGLLSMTVGAGIILGALAKRASRSRKVVAEAQDQLHAFAEANLNGATATQHPWRNKIQQLAISSAMQALSVGVQTLAIPFLERMLASWQKHKAEDRAEQNGAADATEEHEPFSRMNGVQR